MERPNITNDQALDQARDTVGTFLQNAVAMIDSHFGVGYAEAHPELVGECIRAQGADFNACWLVDAIHGLKDQAQEIGAILATAADTLGNAINPPKSIQRFDKP